MLASGHPSSPQIRMLVDVQYVWYTYTVYRYCHQSVEKIVFFFSCCAKKVLFLSNSGRLFFVFYSYFVICLKIFQLGVNFFPSS